MLCAISVSAPPTDHAALSINPVLLQTPIDRAAPSANQAGLISMGQVGRFIVASTVRVRWVTIQMRIVLLLYMTRVLLMDTGRFHRDKNVERSSVCIEQTLKPLHYCHDFLCY